MRTLDEAKAYLTQLAKEAGLDESATTAIVTGLGNEKFGKGIVEAMARHDEMSSAMDRAKNEIGKYESKVKEYDEWYNKTALPAVNEATQLREQLTKYQTTYGDLSAGPTATTPPAGDWVRKADFDKRVSEVGLSAVQVAKQLTKCSADYMKRFGDVLDPDELEKFAVSRGLPPDAAYREMIQPRLQEVEKKAAEEREAKNAAAIKAAYEQGVKDQRAKRDWGSETTRTDTDVFGRDKEALKKGESDAEDGARNEFLKAWQEAEEAAPAR